MSNSDNTDEKKSLPHELYDYVKDGGGYDAGLSAFALAHGIPIPPSIFRRIRIAAGRIIDGGGVYIAGGFERLNAKANFKIKTQQQIVTTLAKQGAADLIDSDEEIARSVAHSMLNEYGYKFQNRNNIVKIAIENLQAEPPTSDPVPDEEISIDWLNYFSDIAAQKSNPEMQTLMGKILAGEIRRPGSFSPLAISVLSTLTMPVAKKFEALCSVSLRHGPHNFISLDIFPDFASKGIQELNFTYSDFIELKSYQLLSTESASSFSVSVGSSVGLYNFQDLYFFKALVPDSNNTARNLRKINSLLFTSVGNELSSLISATAPDFFKDNLLKTYSEPNWNTTRGNVTI